MTDIVLARLDQARLALQEASTIPEVKRFVDLAATAETWARQQKLGSQVVTDAYKFKLRALRRLGEMLDKSELLGPQHFKGGGSKGSKREPLPDAPPSLTELGLDKKTSALAQKLASLAEELFEEMLLRADSISSILPGKAHVGHATGESEWYTPSDFIKAARATMGDIDLDPASSRVANAQIQAKRFYSKEDDGLSKPWNGRVWMNPPYKQPLIQEFCEKLSREFEFGRVLEAVVLVNNATETNWFEILSVSASAVCFPRGRVRFWNQSGESGAPLQGQAVLYLGPNPRKFVDEYHQFGICATWV